MCITSITITKDSVFDLRIRDEKKTNDAQDFHVHHNLITDIICVHFHTSDSWWLEERRNRYYDASMFEPFFTYYLSKIKSLEIEICQSRGSAAYHREHHITKDCLVHIFVGERPRLFDNSIDPLGSFNVRKEYLIRQMQLKSFFLRIEYPGW